MAKTTAPLLSFGATGTVAKTAVYATWRGVPYVRRHVIPNNPKTVGQQTTRTTFAALREMWKRLPADGRAPWDAFAKGRKFTGMNAFVGENMRVVRGEVDFTSFLASPGAAGGLSLASLAAVPGALAGEVDVTVTVDTPPAGWTVAGIFALGFPDQDPSADFGGPFVIGSVAVEPYDITLAGFTSAATIIVGAWAKWTKPDGSVAYSPGLTTSAAAT